MSEIKMNKTTKWSFSVGKIAVEVVNWQMSDKMDCWNFYLLIHERDVKPQVWEQIWRDGLVKKWFSKGSEHIDYDYYSIEKLARLPWHGDITYYEANGRHVGHRYIKCGCDYQHHFDQGQQYDAAYVGLEANECAKAALTALEMEEVK